MPLVEKFNFTPNSVIFKGAKHIYTDTITQKEAIGAKVGIALANKKFNEGSITADVMFKQVDERSSCEIIFNYISTSGNYLSAGISSAGGMFGAKSFINGNFNFYKMYGDHRNLMPNRVYKIEIKLKGSNLKLFVDEVEVISFTIPLSIMQSQVGLFCMSQSDIIIKNFNVISEKPKVFMVMQFDDQNNDLYADVVREICTSKEYDLNVVKADEIYGPGIIISDITKSINESKIVIAEITQGNSNVFYEVGYAHALNKPTILIAQKDTKLPFDVSPFRILFYENTIAGKKRVEEGLKKHLNAILT